MVDLYGVIFGKQIYLSKESSVLEVLKNYFEKEVSTENVDLGDVKNISKRDLDELYEKHKILDVVYNLVEAGGKIESKTDYEKVDVLFLHFHDLGGIFRMMIMNLKL